MNVLWSPHAEKLLDEIVIGIAFSLLSDDGIRWEGRLLAALTLGGIKASASEARPRTSAVQESYRKHSLEMF